MTVVVAFLGVPDEAAGGSILSSLNSGWKYSSQFTWVGRNGGLQPFQPFFASGGVSFGFFHEDAGKSLKEYPN